MTLVSHLLRVREALQVDYLSALSFMAENVIDIAEDRLVVEAMYTLAQEDAQPQKLSKSARKDRRKSELLRAQLAAHYHGVDHKVARWGHEAHADGLRAFGIDRSHKTSPKLKMTAHETARQSHLVASHRLAKAGHKSVADMHKRAANYHASRLSDLRSKHGPQDQDEDVASDARTARTHAHMAAWRASRLRQKLAAPKPKRSATVSESLELPDLVEGKFHADARKASSAAAKATRDTRLPFSTVDHHEAAARLHFIAHGVAKAHGHTGLAKKHKSLIDWHRKEASVLRVADR